MTTMRIREVKDKDTMATVLDDYITIGYSIKEHGASTTLVQKKTWGSPFGLVAFWAIGLLVAIFTFGIGLIIPIAYMLYSHSSAEKVLIRIGEEPNTRVGGSY